MLSPASYSPLLVATALLGLSTSLAAQGQKPKAPPPEETDEPPPAQAPAVESPSHAFDFALGGDGLWFGYRNGQQRGHGYISASFFAGEDNDYALAVRLMRFGEPASESPFGFGIGLGAFGATVDDTNSEVAAITITGAADFALDKWFVLDYPMRVGVEVSYAPDQATFGDGTRVLDALGRFEVDLSAWATAFVGYRHLAVDIDGEDDAELDSAFHAGVRLGF